MKFWNDSNSRSLVEGKPRQASRSALLHKFRPSKKLVVFGISLVGLLASFAWIFDNTTLLLSRLFPDGESVFYATREEMMAKRYDGAVHWFRGWRAVPKDAVDIAYAGVTTSEGCGPWETRLTCRTSKDAFMEMAKGYGYAVATNCFENVLAEKDGGVPNDSAAFVEVLPELWSFTMPSEYLTFTCLTTNYTGMVILLNCRSGKLYARLINKWRFGDPNDWSWLNAVPKVEYLMRNEHEVK